MACERIHNPGRVGLFGAIDMSSPAKIRVGAVSYLNTKPLIYGFERFAPDAELVLDYPEQAGRRAGRRHARRRADPVDRVLSRPDLHDRFRRLHRLPRAGAVGEAVQPRADRTRFAPSRSTKVREPARP